MDAFSAFFMLLLLALLVVAGVAIGIAIADSHTQSQQRVVDEVRRITEQTKQGMDERKALYTLEVLDFLKAKEKTNGTDKE